MEQQVLRLTVDGRGVARMTLNRPELRNAFNEELIGAICDAMGRLSADKAVRAIVMTGAGAAFCGGADLTMMRRVADYSPDENKDDARRLAHMLNAIYSAAKPVIALVNGPAMGGGVGLIAACDIAIGADTAFFALSEARLGLVPAVISPFVVAAIGARQARRYFLTGERFDADAARRIGLLHMVCMPEQLEATLDSVVAELLQCGPVAQAEAKDLIAAVVDRPVTEQLMEETAGRIARIRASKEGKEGLQSFLEKRKPDWAN